MKPSYELVRLANATFSVRSAAEGETFHPVIGPVAEAEALYVRQLQLPRRAAATDPFVIWDIGLGAAANILSVFRSLGNLQSRLRVLSFDKTTGPLEFALGHAQQLGYFQGYEEQVAEFLREGRAFGGKWRLCLGDFPAWLKQNLPAPAPHAILFDPFSPARNPAMWTADLFADLYRRLDPARPCAMPTYSRSTMLRVTLLLAGFFVGVGHATGEKEETTIAANSLDLIGEPLPRSWLERAAKSKSAEPLWEPIYRQQPLSAESAERLRAHPQFR